MSAKHKKQSAKQTPPQPSAQSQSITPASPETITRPASEKISERGPGSVIRNPSGQVLLERQDSQLEKIELLEEIKLTSHSGPQHLQLSDNTN